MVSTCSSETSVDFQRTTLRNIPEDTTLHFLSCCYCCGRAITQAVSCRLPTTAARFGPNSCHVGFVGQVLSEYFDVPCQVSFHRLLHTHHHLSSGAGTEGQLLADVPSGLSLAPTKETKKKSTTGVEPTRVKTALVIQAQCPFWHLGESHPCPLQ
jgi:hypothetical protein